MSCCPDRPEECPGGMLLQSGLLRIAHILCDRKAKAGQETTPICSVTTAPCPALHKPTAFRHSHFPLICGSSLPITGGLHITPCLSVRSYVFSWLRSSPYLLTLLRTPHQELRIPALSSIFGFFNLSTQEWPHFFLKDNHEEHSRNSLL